MSLYVPVELTEIVVPFACVWLLAGRSARRERARIREMADAAQRGQVIYGAAPEGRLDRLHERRMRRRIERARLGRARRGLAGRR